MNTEEIVTLDSQVIQDPESQSLESTTSKKKKITFYESVTGSTEEHVIEPQSRKELGEPGRQKRVSLPPGIPDVRTPILKRRSFSFSLDGAELSRHYSSDYNRLRLVPSFTKGDFKDELDDLDDESLVKTVEELQKQTNYLKIENLVFQHFLEKTEVESDADLKTDGQKHLELAASSSSRRFSSSGRYSSSRASQVSALFDAPKINLTQKSELVQREMEDVRNEFDACQEKNKKIRFNLEARIEEIQIRKTELLETIENFEKAVYDYDDSSNLPVSVKFCRFMEEWSRKTRFLIDKIRLRYSSLKVQCQKISNTLAQKQLIGENLQEIDFEQLRIENLHLSEKVEQQNALLLELKNFTGLGNLKLSQLKAILQQKIQQKDELEKAIKIKEKEVARMDNEIYKLYSELDDIKNVYYKIRDKVKNYKAPEVIEYVKKKTELDSLKRDLKVWLRRRNIKEMALSATITDMKRITGAKRPDPVWFE